METITLDKLFIKTVSFLNKEKIPYMIIGGLAVGMLGEARATQDIDLIVFITRDSVKDFLRKAKTKKFGVAIHSALKQIKERGTCRLKYKNLWVDVIFASTEFETEALKRRQRVKLLGQTVYFPSPEDLILLKIIPGREKDILDAKSIILRHKGKLDKGYLEKWTMRLSDMAEDLRMWNELKGLL